MQDSPAGFELFDHTADLGVRVCAATLPDLVAPAAAGLYAATGELESRESVSAFQYSADGTDSAVLLRDFLSELLHEFEVHGRVVRDIRVTEFTDRRLAVEGRLFDVDREKSVFGSEVKAVTYHELAIRRTERGGFEATFILDI